MKVPASFGEMDVDPLLYLAPPYAKPTRALDERFGWWAHVPLLQLEGVARIDFGDGVLIAPTFEEWYAWDPAFEGRRAEFTASAPVFYCTTMPRLPGDPDVPPERTASEVMATEDPFGPAIDSVADLFRATAPVFDALNLVANGRLLEPPFSAAYCHDFFINGTIRTLGPGGVELLLHADESSPTVLDADGIERALDIMAKRQTMHGTMRQAVDATFRGFVACGRRDWRSTDRFAQAVTTLEGLLIGERPSGLTRTLSRRLAALMGRVGDPRAVAFGRALYAARSSLIHGQVARTEHDMTVLVQEARRLPDLPGSAEAIARTMVERSLTAVLDGFVHHDDVAAFHADLDEQGGGEIDQEIAATVRPMIKVRLIYPLHGAIGADDRYAVLPSELHNESFSLQMCSSSADPSISIERLRPSDLRVLEPNDWQAILSEAGIDDFFALCFEFEYADFDTPLINAIENSVGVHRNVIALLRVFDRGNFVDPEGVCIYTLEYQDGAFVGPPGQFAGPFRLGPWVVADGLQLGTELMVDVRTYLLILLGQHPKRPVPVDPIVWDAIHSFSRSRAPWLDNATRVTFVCSSIETMLGRWIDKVVGVSFAARVAALSTNENDSKNLELFLEHHARQVRNSAVHGMPVSDDDADLLRAFGAAAILSYLDWCIDFDGPTRVSDWNTHLGTVVRDGGAAS